MSQASHQDSNNPIAAFGSFAEKYEKGTGGATRYIAKWLVDLSPPFTSTSIILDNACGTGIVTDEILQKLKKSADDGQPNTSSITVYAADAAAPMTDTFKSKLANLQNHDPTTARILTKISIHTARAEDLTSSIVPSDTITHSYTNFGLFFCADPPAAAQHIYRTLAPGGTAFITTWADLGYLEPVRQTEAAMNPDNANFEMPFSRDWEDPEYVTRVLAEAGFAPENIQVRQEESYFKAGDADELAVLLADLFTMLMRKGEWEGEQKAAWATKLKGILVEDATGHFVEGFEEGGVAVRMLANVAVCRK